MARESSNSDSKERWMISINFVSSIRNDVHAINGRQRSLAQSMTAESRNTRDQISLQGRNQETAFRDSGRMIVQLQADVQHTDTQVEVLLALA